VGSERSPPSLQWATARSNRERALDHVLEYGLGASTQTNLPSVAGRRRLRWIDAVAWCQVNAPPADTRDVAQ
jgi:hypothetical protein